MINFRKISREKPMCHEVVPGMDKDINLQLDFCLKKYKYSGSSVIHFIRSTCGCKKSIIDQATKMNLSSDYIAYLYYALLWDYTTISHPHWLTRFRRRPFKMGKNIPQSSAFMESPELNMTLTNDIICCAS